MFTNMKRILSFFLVILTAFSVFTLGVSGKSDSVQINIAVEGAGKATKSLTAEKGDRVSLSVKADELARFLGWYENGKLVTLNVFFEIDPKGGKKDEKVNDETPFSVCTWSLYDSIFTCTGICKRK